MIKKSLRMAGLVVMAAVGMASAHLSLSGFNPAGGESLKPGDSFTITWSVDVQHQGGTDIAFSKDGGTTWTDVKKGVADGSTKNSFKWTVPNQPTTTGKIRICQLAGAVCTDANNISKPGGAGLNGSAPYVLVSNALTIAPATGITTPANQANPLTVDFHPETRNVDVSFGLTESKEVLLQVFDSQGRLLATLVQGAFASGPHKLSLFSNRLVASGGTLLFKLKVGDQVLSHTWTLLR